MAENEPIIAVEHLYKRYERMEYRPSLRHEALSLIRRLLRRTSTMHAEKFYALHDVSFTIHRGESVGIVGRNGSGKTTLLRVISGVVQPTSGRVTVRGSFAALLGLAAGFLPELSGRKNVYLNAAIYGVPPRQIDDIIDDIIDFAEIRPFIDTPVKRYSSGMLARLGFSIAIHIVPDIVLLDEVLAVGDAAFQEKCQRRMHEIRDQGRTLLFVSHSAYEVTEMCERAIWLHDGRLMADGPSAQVVAQYHRAILEGSHAPAVSP